MLLFLFQSSGHHFTAQQYMGVGAQKRYWVDDKHAHVITCALPHTHVHPPLPTASKRHIENYFSYLKQCIDTDPIPKPSEKETKRKRDRSIAVGRAVLSPNSVQWLINCALRDLTLPHLHITKCFATVFSLSNILQCRPFSRSSLQLFGPFLLHYVLPIVYFIIKYCLQLLT